MLVIMMMIFVVVTIIFKLITSFSFFFQVLITDKCVAVVNDLKTMLPRLRRLATAKLNTDQVDEFTNIMTELVKCVFK